MIDQQTLMTVLSVFGVLVTLIGYLHTMKRDLDHGMDQKLTGVRSDLRETERRLAEKIDSMQSGLSEKIDSQTGSLRGDILDLRSALRVLEQRTFEMVHHCAVPSSTDAGTASA